MYEQEKHIVTCQSIQELPQCKGLSLIAGEAGLQRQIRWVHYVEEPSYIRFINGGELILTTGMLLSDKDSFLNFITDLHQKGVSGIVINEPPHGGIPYLPEITALGEKLGLCIFSLPFHYRFVDITQSICQKIFASEQFKHRQETLLWSLFFGQSTNDPTLQELFRSYEMKQGNSFTCFAIRFLTKEGSPCHLQSLAYRINQIMNFNHPEDGTLLSLQHGCELLCLYYNVRNKHQTPSNDFYQNLLAALSSEFPDFRLHAGIGEPVYSPETLRHSMENARHMAALASQLEQQILSEKHAEVFRIFHDVPHPESLESIYKSMMQPLLDYDTKHQSSLVQTLLAYLLHDCRLQETADHLFVHYNTLRYRLRTAETLLGVDLRSYQAVSRLMLAMNIRQYLDCTDLIR